MTPNAVTTVPLNLPVLNEKRPDERVVISDFVGISATSNTGALPVLMGWHLRSPPQRQG